MKNCIVRINNNDGVQYHSVNLEQGPIVVGRDWNADVVLEDRFVDPQHLHISLADNGDVLLKDLGTVNGTLLKRRRIGATPVSYKWGQALRVGDSKITIIDAEAQLEPTLLRSNWVGVLSNWSNPWMWVLSLALLTLVQVGEKYLNSNQAFDLYKALYQIWPSIAAVLCVTIFFGLLSRLLKGENNFGPLWILSCWSVIVTSVANFLVKVVRFNWQSLDAGQLLSDLNGSVIFVVFMFALLSVVTNLRTRSRLGVSVGIAGVILASSYSADFFKEERQKWRAGTQTEQSTLPKSFLVRGETEYQTYLQEVDGLFMEVDNEVERLADLEKEGS